MKVNIELIDDKENERVIIECTEVSKDVKSIKAYAEMRGSTLAGIINGNIHRFNLDDVYYFEAIGERVFAYTQNKVYEMRSRLYELEEAYSIKKFVRCSKSFIINLMELEYIRPELNGRFIAHMKNDEKVIVSRSYVPQIKKIVIGGNKDEL